MAKWQPSWRNSMALGSIARYARLAYRAIFTLLSRCL
jgi:hypothetical protein